MTHFRVSAQASSGWHSAWSSSGIGGTVAFDYGDGTVRVADVDEAEAEANHVIAALADAGVT